MRVLWFAHCFVGVTIPVNVVDVACNYGKIVVVVVDGMSGTVVLVLSLVCMPNISGYVSYIPVCIPSMPRMVGPFLSYIPYIPSTVWNVLSPDGAPSSCCVHPRFVLRCR